MLKSPSSALGSSDLFLDRHIGPSEAERAEMLHFLKVKSLDQLISALVPEQIRMKKPTDLGPPRNETEVLAEFKKISLKNRVFKSFIGMGYSGCTTPAVIQRNILENPGWYTQYTPYQSEIAQGRLEALLNFQTLVCDFTGLPVANASLLDEGTAAAEAMVMCFQLKGKKQDSHFFVAHSCHPQTIAVVQTRAEPLGIKVTVGDPLAFDFKVPLFGMLLQYPDTYGSVLDYSDLIVRVHQSDALVVLAADLLSLALLKSPGELGADIAVGSSQRFGVPLGYGGPHAAFFATKEEYKRQIPGRIVGLSQDVDGKPAIRLALQTREQHIRRDKATSNICTSQVLLAVISSMYAVYHGPEGIRKIADRVYRLTLAFRKCLQELGYSVQNAQVFDTLLVQTGKDLAARLLVEARRVQINLRFVHLNAIGISFDEVTEVETLERLFQIFAAEKGTALKQPFREVFEHAFREGAEISGALKRTSAYLTHPVFHSHHSETKMLRYLHRLQAKDLSLTHSMIPLGSCTMKLNATSEMIPVTWDEIGNMHPFAPLDQAEGYQQLFKELERMLREVTGLAAVSLQPNAGSQGEYAGLLVIRKYHLSRDEGHRSVCLIPRSAHGTNPASAALAGMKVVVVECDQQGNVDIEDLRVKAKEHRKDLAALMVTYPSTHGVFEEGIQEICSIVHENGGQVYMDGANMNAQIGLCRPGDFGPDVCHLNLHKTFCIPHGGGGPGMGPIGVAQHLAPFLPSHPVIQMGSEQGIGPVSAAPWGSSSILPISWMYISMMGAEGLRTATEVAILNANYIAKRLEPHYPVLFKGKNGWVAHECIFDLRPLKDSTGIEVEDVAKRLMDYGFHAPTVSFPVAGTLMVEPTESESKEELDRFCEAMIGIRQEIQEIQDGKADRKNNVLKHAPHTAEQIARSVWDHPYSREKAVYPLEWVRERKFWPSVGRINNVLGDRNLICTCAPIGDYE